MRVCIIASVLAAASAFSPIFAESWPPTNIVGLAEYAPKPGPQPGLHGSGVFILRIHIPSGHVTEVSVGLSTGSDWLDRSAIFTLRRWRFKPGAVPYRAAKTKVSPPQAKNEAFIKVPVTFL
jgi:TonB family protein